MGHETDTGGNNFDTRMKGCITLSGMAAISPVLQSFTKYKLKKFSLRILNPVSVTLDKDKAGNGCLFLFLYPLVPTFIDDTLYEQRYGIVLFAISCSQFLLWHDG